MLTSLSISSHIKILEINHSADKAPKNKDVKENEKKSENKTESKAVTAPNTPNEFIILLLESGQKINKQRMWGNLSLKAKSR